MEMGKGDITGSVIGCAIEVHRQLGPGLLESAYKQCLAHELGRKGIGFEVEWALPVRYKGLALECGYRIDLLVERHLIVELKSVKHILAIHKAQLLTYMNLAQVPLGLLINFNTVLLKQGISRLIR